MKKAYKPGPQTRSVGVIQLGALVAVVAGIVLLGGAALAFWQNNGSQPRAAFTPEALGAPRVKADRQKVDLGDVKLGQVVQVSFEITNTGDQTLRFVNDPFVEVVAGC